MPEWMDDMSRTEIGQAQLEHAQERVHYIQELVTRKLVDERYLHEANSCLLSARIIEHDTRLLDPRTTKKFTPWVLTRQPDSDDNRSV